MDMLSEKLRTIYNECGADALFLERDFLRQYLTGFYSTDGYVVLDGETCSFVADLRYFEAAERALRGNGVTVIEGGYSKALELVNGKKTLGVAYPFTDAARYLALQKAGFALVDCMPALKHAMEIKSEEEIFRIQKACEIAEDALISLLPELKEGMTETDAAALLEYKMRAFGAGGVSFDTIVAFGANGSVPHHETGETRLKFGDPVLIDFGCKWKGYCSDCTRTFLFGDDKKHQRFKTAYAHVLKAHMLVKERLTDGMTGRQADAIARDYLKANELDKFFSHSLGHGIGVNIHEFPRLSTKSEDVLRNNMVFSDEPGVYFEGDFGIRIEDTVTLIDGKAVSLTDSDKNLIIL